MKNISKLLLNQKTMSYLYSHVSKYWVQSVFVLSRDINGLGRLFLSTEILPSLSVSSTVGYDRKLFLMR